ncbi:hypothetical protein [Rhodoferax sp. GW822-FHT02A01]|uniref:hypothetical protein n=1 Tax=Rhodoferax sp. GW822-FHT02A01 TaxID=3141537 RepID=UPI00315C8ADD
MGAINWDEVGVDPSATPASGGGSIDWNAVNQAHDVPAKATAPASVNKNYEAGKQLPGAVRGLASVLNGPFMGFYDEALGGLGAGIQAITDATGLTHSGKSFSENYRLVRDGLRGAQDQQQQENPVTTAVTQTMASAPLLASDSLANAGSKVLPYLPKFLQGSGVVASTAKGAATGGAFGAVSGAGNSTAEDTSGVLADAGQGAVGGALYGGASIPVARGVGAVGGNIAQRVSSSSAYNYAQQKVAQALANDARGNVFKSGQANPVNQVSARLNTLGPDATITDAAGKSTNQLLDTMATLPGRTKDAAEQLIHDRQAGRGNRLINAASDALDTQGQNLNSQLDQWVADRAKASAPLYNQLQQVSISPSSNLQSIVQTADQLGATSLGREMATAKQMPFTLDANNPASWNMGDLDHVKQGIDQILTSRKAMNPDGTLTPLGNAYQSLKTKLVGELDNATTNPDTGTSLYKTARDAFAGPSALIDAANQGRAAISKDGVTIGRMTSGMSDSEAQAFKLGAFEALRNKLGTQAGQTQILNMWKEPAMQDKLKAIFGNELAYRSFAANVAKEASMKGFETVGRGSQTAARQYGAGDLDTSALADAGGAVAAAKAGHITGALAAAGKAWNSVSTPQTVRDQIGQILMSKGALAQDNLGAILPITNDINRRNSLMTQQLGGLLGLRIGSQLATPMQFPGLLND